MTVVDWPSLESWVRAPLEIVGAVTLLAALIFAVARLYFWRVERRDERDYWRDR